jgi:hypothetical protein
MKAYHLALEANASKILRGICEWDLVGHVHLMMVETAIKTVEHTGHRIVDLLLTDSSLRTRQHMFRNHLVNLPRRPLGMVFERFCARALAGSSLLILTEQRTRDNIGDLSQIEKGIVTANGTWAIVTYEIAIHWFWSGNMTDDGKAAEWG